MNLKTSRASNHQQTAMKTTHKRSPSSWSRVLGLITAKGRRFWPCNTRPVDPENFGEQKAGEKTDRVKTLLITYNNLCKSSHATESELIQGESTLTDYLDEGLEIARQLARSPANSDPDRIYLERSAEESKDDYDNRAGEFERNLKSPFHAHVMDYALLIPRAESHPEDKLIDWKNLKVKNPALSGMSQDVQLAWKRDIATKLLSYANEADYETNDVAQMNLEQYTRYVEARRAGTAQMEAELIGGAGANNQPAGLFYFLLSVDCLYYFLL